MMFKTSNNSQTTLLKKHFFTKLSKNSTEMVVFFELGICIYSNEKCFILNY